MQLQDPESDFSMLSEDKQVDFQELFNSYYRPLCNYACRILEDSCLAEDIVSASFDKIWRRRNDFPNLNRLVSYLYTITRNASLDEVSLLRKRKTAHEQIAFLSEGKEDPVHNKM
ncbi:MAG TPA: sigma factor, partial [Puia sp.]|nr:sigma factor [Puia sp.]